MNEIILTLINAIILALLLLWRALPEAIFWFLGVFLFLQVLKLFGFKSFNAKTYKILFAVTFVVSYFLDLTLHLFSDQKGIDTILGHGIAGILTAIVVAVVIPFLVAWFIVRLPNIINFLIRPRKKQSSKPTK